MVLLGWSACQQSPRVFLWKTNCVGRCRRWRRRAGVIRVNDTKHGAVSRPTSYFGQQMILPLVFVSGQRGTIAVKLDFVY